MAQRERRRLSNFKANLLIAQLLRRSENADPLRLRDAERRAVVSEAFGVAFEINGVWDRFVVSALLRACFEMRYGFGTARDSDADHFGALWRRIAEMERVRADDVENPFPPLAKCVIERRDAAKCADVLRLLRRRTFALKLRDAFVFKLIALLRGGDADADADTAAAHARLSLFELALSEGRIVNDGKQLSAYTWRGLFSAAQRTLSAMVCARAADAVSALMTALIDARRCLDALRLFDGVRTLRWSRWRSRSKRC